MNKFDNSEFPSLSSKTFKLMKVDGKEEIFAQDFHSAEWNDGKEDFGVKKINQLSDTTNGLTDKTKELTKTANELTSVSKEQTNTINELIKRIQQLEEDGKKDVYYEGEYKWMPTTVTSMPKGWTKVEMVNGYTLINSKSEGKTRGAVQQHQHSFITWDSVKGEFLEARVPTGSFITRKVSKGDNYSVPIYTTTNIGWDSSLWTSDLAFNHKNNTDENLPAGLCAQLWQYDPNGTFTQLREEAIKNQRLKEELENKKVEKDK